MREVVNSLQMSVMKYHVGTSDYPASRNEQTLVQQVEQLKMQIQTANKHRQKVIKYKWSDWLVLLNNSRRLYIHHHHANTLMLDIDIARKKLIIAFVCVYKC